MELRGCRCRLELLGTRRARLVVADHDEQYKGGNKDQEQADASLLLHDDVMIICGLKIIEENAGCDCINTIKNFECGASVELMLCRADLLAST